MKGFTLKGLIASALIFVSTMVYADGGRMTIPNNPKWKEECGSCHIAFPPQLLTAESWQRLMGGLDKHFGSNAVLDKKENQEILDFLQRYAGSGARHNAASMKISDTSWFIREHREVSRRAWAHPSVKSPSNCSACHVNAERGDWSERGIRMPGGMRMEEDDDD